MQTTSALYKQILSNKDHIKEIKVEINGIEYREDNIISLKTSGGIFNKFSVGNASAKEIDLSVFPIEEIPRMAEIKVYFRLCYENLQSEWLPKGTFFIDTRAKDEYTGALTIHGYDAMLKAEQLWAGQVGVYQTTAAQEIASRIGVGFDARNELNSSYSVVSDEDYTMRDILKNIASCNGGNWIITDENNLLLIKLGDVSTETNYLVDDNGFALLFGEVRIIV